MREFFKKIPLFKYAVLVYRAALPVPSYPKRVRSLVRFFWELHAFRKLQGNPSFSTSTADLFPRLYDNTSTTRLDPVYFYQDAWFASKIIQKNPEYHVDVGSHAPTIGILSQCVPTTMVDIRPLPVSLPGLTFVKGTLENLPFQDSSLLSLSSICVIEHIGLGRYGDPLDPYGSEKAAQELTRVLAPDGLLYISVPVDDMSRVYFNAHRSFTRDHLLSLFSTLSLVEEKYIYGDEMKDEYDQKRGFGTGLYLFTKKKL